MRDTLVIVPAYNEEDALPVALADLRDHFPDGDVLVVDDGSSDRTVEVARLHGAMVAQLPFNMGVGGALRTGFRYAVRNGYQRAIQFDGDGQHDAAQITRLLGRLDAGADMTIGSRFATANGSYSVGATRGLAMSLLRCSVSFLAGTRLTDTSSGFRAFGPRALSLFEKTYPRDYLSDTVEAILIASYEGLRIDETPVEMRERAAGTASQRSMKLAYHYVRLWLLMLLTLSFSGRRNRRHRTTTSTGARA